MKKLLMVGFFLIISSIVYPQNSLACSCVAPGDVQTELNRNQAVFTGKVEKVRSRLLSNHSSVTFSVHQAWKGIDEKTITINTPTHSSACGFTFIEGAEYLVFAFENDSGTLETSICSRTKTTAKAAEDLMFLGDGEVSFNDHNWFMSNRHAFLTLLFAVPSTIVIVSLLSFLRRNGRL
ncbi:hypothetical protein WAK64_06985 [Bacillus spongiae]|uniref:Tissue inhibitor of metalloproteinase n=1 Tax=Bacillus spongiae TaxID=2683610 RepID=A0ABU8HC35_9BACI